MFKNNKLFQIEGNVTKKEKIGIVALALLIPLILGALYWICTCGIVYLFTLCFNVEFSWLKATLIWANWIIIDAIFNSIIGKSKHK